MENTKILLERITLENFKGCAARTFDFGGRNVTIYGANGAGKSTVYHALTWLLFDKIAGDDGKVMTAPDVKPQNDAGEVLDHAAVTSVEAVFNVDGAEIKLKRNFFEVWKKTRGKDASVLSGHTSEYFWDDVPITLSDFTARLKDWIPDENLFWTLSNIHWFCRGMDWKKRREILTEVCGLPDDRTILAANPGKFDKLASGMGEKSLPDYRAYLDAQIKKLNAAQKTFPARLDEVKKSIAELSGFNFHHAKIIRDQTENIIQQHIENLAKLNNGTLIGEKRNELNSVKNKMNTLEIENQRFRQSQTVPVEDRRPALNEDLKRWQMEFSRNERQKEQEKETGMSLRARVQDLSEQYRNLTASAFTAISCPTCGQALPPDAQEKAKVNIPTRKRGGFVRSESKNAQPHRLVYATAIL